MLSVNVQHVRAITAEPTTSPNVLSQEKSNVLFFFGVVSRSRRSTGKQLGLWKQSWAKGLFFGMNVLHERKGVLRIGDEVQVLRVAKKAPPDTGTAGTSSSSGLKAD